MVVKVLGPLSGEQAEEYLTSWLLDREGGDPAFADGDWERYASLSTSPCTLAKHWLMMVPVVNGTPACLLPLYVARAD